MSTVRAAFSSGTCQCLAGNLYSAERALVELIGDVTCLTYTQWRSHFSEGGTQASFRRMANFFTVSIIRGTLITSSKISKIRIAGAEAPPPPRVAAPLVGPVS